MTTFKCPQCGGDFQAESEGRYHCLHCDNTLAIHLHVHGKIPWESWREQGRLRAFYDTWKQVMTNPSAFFKRVPPKGNMILPMYYGVICQSIAIVLMWTYQAGFNFLSSVLDHVAAFGGYGPFTITFGWPAMAIFILALAMVAPLFAMTALFFTSILYHICLKILGGASMGFEATFRAMCYGSSAQVLGILPIVGGVIAGVWSVVLTVIGIKQMQRTTYFKAIFAVILPVIACFILVTFVVVLIVVKVLTI